MNLKNSDEIILQLDMLLNQQKYSEDQKSAIRDCIEVIKNTPTETRYKDLGPQVAEAIRKARYPRESL